MAHVQHSRRDQLLRSIYYAPRGRLRLYALAAELSQRYLLPTDHLVGVIGGEGAGKSTLIKGLFPGLELTNDDDGINKPTSPLFSFDPTEQFSGHTFHLDARYEMAFHQVHEIAEAIREALHAQRRVVVEHFDLVYRQLGFNAQILFAIGEEVRVYRPTIFGPSPLNVRRVAVENLKFRLMAHSAEDLVGRILRDDYGFSPDQLHSEVHHGFVIGFDRPPEIDLAEVERKVLDLIEQDIEIAPGEGDHVLFSGQPFYCTGKRCHVKRTGQIERFRLLKEYKFDPMTRRYLMVGIVGDEEEPIEFFDELPPAQTEFAEQEVDPSRIVEVGLFKGKVY